MKVIHVLRKPLSEGTVAANTLRHECGGLNIAASRISTEDSLNGGAYAENPTHRAGQDMWTRDRKGDTNCFKRGAAGRYEQPTGRWPGNLILQHLDGCRCAGTTKVRSPMRRPTGKPIYATEGSAVEWNANNVRDTTVRGHADEDGNETIANWVCVEGCPVRALDKQSGVSRSAVRVGGVGENLDPTKKGWRFKRAEGGYTDNGAASRFFKQIGGDHEGTP